jgi:hypothetical protein
MSLESESLTRSIIANFPEMNGVGYESRPGSTTKTAVGMLLECNEIPSSTSQITADTRFFFYLFIFYLFTGGFHLRMSHLASHRNFLYFLK